jgi:hypothetical protein
MVEQIYQSTSPFEWASQHLHLIGWPALILIAWKVRGAVDKFFTHVMRVEGSIHKWDTNHLPHMQDYLQSIDTNIKILVDRSPRK